jgi:hypothetical protein
VSVVSSTSTKDTVRGGSVGGRVSQTRGVTLSAPNSTVLFMGISKWEMRPVTLSRAANTAIGFLMISAWAWPEANTRASKTRLSPLPIKRAALVFACAVMPHIVRTDVLTLVPVCPLPRA